MGNEIEYYEKIETVSERDTKKKYVWLIVCIVIALISFFGISRWATSVETYSGVIRTLNDLQKKALEMAGASTALATGAAAVPGDATTPIANKLADVAGYMVIVYIAIILEKYLLTLTGFVTFKIFVPVGFVLAAAGQVVRTEWKGLAYRMAVKCILLGLLLWCLVPASAWVSNRINETYQLSSEIDSALMFGSDGTEEDTQNASGDSDKDTDSDSGEKEDEGFSVGNSIIDFANKVKNAVKDTGKAAVNKIDVSVEKFENALNRMIEGVAVMIVTTCVIPILVLLLFVWLLKIVTGVNLPMPTAKALPKASKIVNKRKQKVLESKND